MNAKRLLIPLLALACVLSFVAALAAAPATADWTQKDRELRKKVDEINSKTGARQISAADLEERLKRGERIVILDVREPKEMEVSALPGARLAPSGEVRTMPLNGIPADATVVTYCTVGYRSGKAAVVLE
ncbi:MAG TPA: rhodanese-like domain-containing protein, partial [Thermoanaerobaculia bacterium]|nr:rhodanese-like domain-containing protein [Thermoanaerobaculia bacterium]